MCVLVRMCVCVCMCVRVCVCVCVRRHADKCTQSPGEGLREGLREGLWSGQETRAGSSVGNRGFQSLHVCLFILCRQGII